MMEYYNPADDPDAEKDNVLMSIFLNRLNNILSALSS